MLEDAAGTVRIHVYCSFSKKKNKKKLSFINVSSQGVDGCADDWAQSRAEGVVYTGMD